MIYLREVHKKQGIPSRTAYPMSARVLQAFEKLSFSHSVTILCGENGSGKTTLMELFSAGVNATPIGDSGVHGEKARLFKTAARQFQFVMNRHPQRSFYFTAEDFSRYLDQHQRMAQEAREDLKQLDGEYQGRSALARSLAAQPFERTLGEMQGQYEQDLLQSSHGEGFLSFFAGRLVSNGLYLLDEPEGALSFANQLSLLALIDQAVTAGGQVIMASHSPVLAAYPNAALLEVGQDGIFEVNYDGLGSIQFLKHFMMHREGILKRSGIQGEA